VPDWTCVRTNDWFSNCYQLAPTTTISAAVAKATGPYSQPFGQCGGIGWTGPVICPPGFYCLKINDWLTQCLPTYEDDNVSTTTAPADVVRARAGGVQHVSINKADSPPHVRRVADLNCTIVGSMWRFDLERPPGLRGAIPLLRILLTVVLQLFHRGRVQAIRLPLRRARRPSTPICKFHMFVRGPARV
jgi:hypothetical protein